MRQCPQCGSELRDSVNICFSCGYRLKETNNDEHEISLEKKYLVNEPEADVSTEAYTPTDAYDPASDPAADETVQDEKKKKQLKIIKMVGVASAFVVLLFIAILISKKSANPADYTTEPITTAAWNGSVTETSSSAGMQTGYVIWNGGVDVYERPDENSTILAHIAVQMQLNIIQMQNGWVQIQLESFTGWCPADRIQLGVPPSTTSAVPQYVALVNSEVGLNLRVSPDTSSKRYLVIPDHAQVNVFTVVNGWANVEYGGIIGWCSAEYLQSPEEASSSMAAASTAVQDTDVSANLTAANLVIDSYRGRSTKYGKLVMDDANVFQFLKDAENVYRAGLCMINMFTSIDQNDMISVGMNYYRYYRVTDPNFQSVADVCEFVFSFFSNEISAELLRDRLLEKDGKLYALYSENSGSLSPVQTDFSITSKTDTQIIVTAVVTGANGNTAQKVYPCVIEDGNWVFNHMELFNEGF